MPTAVKPLPITVFTGFLGSGKTTQILSLLQRVPKDYKVCLLKNEFGDIAGKYIYLFSISRQLILFLLE
jgi:G3E family GTPase